MGEARAWLRWKMVGWREWSGITVRNGLLVTLPVALLLGTLSAFAEAPWPMFQHDLGHTGRSQYVGPAVPNVFWYSYLGSGVFIYGSPVVAEDGSIYGAVEMHGPSGYGGYVFAVNDAGNLEWYLPLGSVLRSTPAIGPDGFLYVASFYPGASDDTLDFYLHKISPDGELVWKREIERDCTPFDRYEYPFSSSPTITPEGLITIVGRERGCLYAFDQSGALLWERDVKADRFQSPAGGKDGLIYVAGFSVGSGHRIFAYDSSGELKRSVGISRIGSDLVVGNSGNIYFADYFYWPEGETQIWVVMPDNTVSPICTVKGRVRRPLAIAGDETIYVVSSDMANSNLWYLTSVDPNGHVNWSVTLGETYGPPTTSVILDSEGNAYVTTTDLLFCFNRIGVMQWQVHAPGYAEGIPAVGADGTLYLYDADATLVAVGENRSPIADAGSDQIASVGWPVKLDGSSSYDPDGDSLSYEWEFVSKPVGSSVTLSNPSSVTTTFIPDKEGEYSIKLTVSDEWGGVSFDTVVVTAEPVESIPELRILFTTNRDGNWEIYSMKPDGSDQINLTHSAAFDVEPWASPDGSRIIFSSDRGCGAGSVRLWLMHYDGTNPVLLTGGTKSWCEPVVHRFAKFFPNQSKVVFTGSLVPGGPPTNRDIYVMDMDASNIINLTKNPAEDQHPAVSPDGTKIAFASNRDGNYDIYIMDIDGSNVRRLTTNPEDDILPEFSPEGDKIIYTSTHNGDDEIYIMKLDGTEKTNLTNNPNGNDAYPVFSPDGRKVAFVSDRDGNWEVYIMNADGSNQARLTYTPQDELEVAFIGMPTVDFVPPALIQNFTASDGENGQSRLAWTNPPDDDLAEVVVRRKTESYPSDHTDGELVYDNAALTPGVAVEYVDTGLANGTTYYYAVFSRDTAGNWNDQVVEGKNADTATPSLENRPPIARASDITGQPTVMYPGVSYAVTAKYFDPDGRDGLKYCYLRLNHPTKPLTMMWYQEDGHAAPWAGEEGENYLTEVNAVTREITDPDTGYEGYEITWLFRINDQWPEVEGAISFGVCALDDNGSSSGWDYLSQGACFIVEVERGNLPPIAFALHYPPNIWGWLLEYLLSGHAPFYETGEEIVFNGFLSMDPDGDIVSYRWDFDDGETASGKLVRHSYDIPGIYNVSLTVEDNEGATDTAIVSVYILPPGEELVEQFKGLVERLIQQAKGILESDIRDGSKKAAEAVDYFLSSIPLDAFDTLFPILCAIIPSNFVKDNPLWGYLIRDLIEQGVSTIEEWQMREVFEALISDPNFSFTKVSDEVAARVSEAVNGLEQARDVVNEIDTLVNTGQLTATEIRAWKKDLAKRMTANVMMGSYFAGQAGLLGTLADIKRIDEASWTLKVGRWLWTASFALSKGIMSVTLSPIVGKAVGLAELTLATASRIEALSSDLQMYLLGHYMLRRAGFLDSMEFPKNFVSAISGNVLRGLGLLRAGESPSTVEGGIESVEKVGKNLYRVTVRNTGSIPARYSLIAMYQKTYTSYELFEGVGRYYELPTYMLYPTDGEGWELAPGASVTVEVELPEEATEFWLNLLGANETGIFGLDSKLKVIQQESWIDVIASWWRGTVGSPVEFGIYDAEGRFTGLKDGVVYEEIPNSIYDEAGRSIWIASGRDFSPLEGLEVVITGTGQGAYDLDLEHSWGVIHAEFSARDIPISTGAMHHYEADWEALASGEPGVTGQIDVDGNGEVDEEIQAGPGLEGIDVQGGEDVAVEFPDQGVGLSLERVLIPGYAFLSICERLPFAPATVVRFISPFYGFAVTAVHEGLITVQLRYEDTALAPGEEEKLRLYKVTEEGRVVDITTDLDTENNVISGVTESFSYFGVGLPLDTTPPLAPAINSPTHPDQNTWYGNNDPTFTWTEPEDPSGIAGYSYVLDQTADTVPDTTVDTTGRTKSYTDVADGIWYFHVRAVDGAGNWGSTAHYRIKVRTVFPTAEITFPEDGTAIRATVNITGTASGDDFDYYTVEYGEGESPSTWTLLHSSREPVTNGTLATWDTTRVSDGEYTIRLSVIDTYTYVVEVRVTVLVDNTPPVIRDVLPIEGDFVPAKPTISATLTDNLSGIDENAILIKLNGNEVDPAPNFDPDTGKMTWTAQAPLPDGDYEVTIDVKDKAGNQAQQARTSFTISSEPAIKNALNYPNPCSSGTTFTYNLSQEAQVRIEIYTLAGELIKVIDPASGEVGYNEQYWDGTDERGYPLDNGVYIYRIVAEADGKVVQAIGKLVILR